MNENDEIAKFGKINKSLRFYDIWIKNGMKKKENIKISIEKEWKRVEFVCSDWYQLISL